MKTIAQTEKNETNKQLKIKSKKTENDTLLLKNRKKTN